MDAKKIGLFIPAYNVEHLIVPVLESISQHDMDRLDKIYIFDNVSTDNTSAVSAVWAENSSGKEKISVFRNQGNYLLGGSTMLAFEKAIADDLDYLICMHSDGQAKTADLKSFFNAIDSPEEYDFILGSRMLPGSHCEGYSKPRLAFNYIFAWIQWLVLKAPVYDIGAYIGFNMTTLQKVPFFNLNPDMGYHPHLILSASQLFKRKLKFKEFPITWGEVESTNVNVIKYALTHLSRIFKIFIGMSPFSDNYRTPMKSDLVFPKEPQ